MKTFRNTVRASKHGLILKNVISDGFPDLLMSRCPEVPLWLGDYPHYLHYLYSVLCTLQCYFSSLSCTLFWTTLPCLRPA